jgi:hypothetical protein
MALGGSAADVSGAAAARPEVFISYSRKVQALLGELRRFLGQCEGDFDLFVDKEGIEAGKRFDEVMRPALGTDRLRGVVGQRRFRVVQLHPGWRTTRVHPARRRPALGLAGSVRLGADRGDQRVNPLHDVKRSSLRGDSNSDLRITREVGGFSLRPGWLRPIQVRPSPSHGAGRGSK